MQPLGRKPSRFPGKTDAHPSKGYVNWWEVEINTGEKKAAARFDAKKQTRHDAAQAMNDRGLDRTH